MISRSQVSKSNFEALDIEVVEYSAFSGRLAASRPIGTC